MKALIEKRCSRMKRIFGIMLVVIIAISSAGCSKSGQKEFPPEAKFSATPEKGEIRETYIESQERSTDYQEINLDAGNSTDQDGKITNYHWIFGDGEETNVSESNINHTYKMGGLFDVELIVQDDDGLTDSTEFKVLINYHKEDSGTLEAVTSSDNQTHTFPVEIGAVNGLLRFYFNSTDLIERSAKVTVYGANDEEIKSVTVSGISANSGTKELEIPLTDADFERGDVGGYTINVETDNGNIQYNIIMDIEYE